MPSHPFHLALSSYLSSHFPSFLFLSLFISLPPFPTFHRLLSLPCSWLLLSSGCQHSPYPSFSHSTCCKPIVPCLHVFMIISWLFWYSPTLCIYYIFLFSLVSYVSWRIFRSLLVHKSVLELSDGVFMRVCQPYTRRFHCARCTANVCVPPLYLLTFCWHHGWPPLPLLRMCVKDRKTDQAAEVAAAVLRETKLYKKITHRLLN